MSQPAKGKRAWKWTGIARAHKEYRGESAWPWVIVIGVPKKYLNKDLRVTITPITAQKRKGRK